MKLFKKIIKILSAILFLIIISISVHFQVKAEKYIKLQVKRYGILENNKREKYKPIVIFYLERILCNKHYYSNQMYLFPYKGVKTNIKTAEFYDSYMVYSYYTDKELHGKKIADPIPSKKTNTQQQKNE